MYTARITRIDKNKRACDFTIEFYKDGELFDTQTLLNINPPSSVHNWILKQIELYKSIDAFDPNTLLGDFDVTQEPIVEESSQHEYLAKRALLKHETENLELGIGSQETVDNLKTELINLKENVTGIHVI